MDNLNKINDVINDFINNGIYNMTIDLASYSNIIDTIALITLPPLLEKIVFISDDSSKRYDFRIVAYPGRIKDLTIELHKVFIYSGDNITIDLRGDTDNKSFYNIIRFSDTNTLKSDNGIGILVMNGQTLEVIGEDNQSVLNVLGGIQNCAIGNNHILDSGGYILFSGQGTVNAYGGDGSEKGQHSYNKAVDGTHGIGFVLGTKGNTSIAVKCSIVVNTYGGNGQECDVSNINSKAVGNGGAGISLGPSGILIVEKCPDVTNSLNAVGGNGGEITDSNNDGGVGDLRQGGNGGDAVQLPNGTVNISGSVNLSGGNGTTVGQQENLPVSGGNGGSAVSFTDDTSGRNTLIIGDNSVLNGGNGGKSGVSVGFDPPPNSIVSPSGGDGGHAVSLGNSPADVSIGSSTLNSGDGGQGGSPKAYVDFGIFDVSDLAGILGGNTPGTGGSNGSAVTGDGKVNLKVSEAASMNPGSVGSGGTGIEIDGSIVKGKNGTALPIIDVQMSNSSPHFGYININRVMDFTLNYNGQESGSSQCEKVPVNIKNMFISQTFNSCLSVDCVTSQQNYDIGTPHEISANIFMNLIINTEVNAYVKELLPIICKNQI